MDESHREWEHPSDAGPRQLVTTLQGHVSAVSLTGGELALALGTEVGFRDTPQCRIVANRVGRGPTDSIEEMHNAPGDQAEHHSAPSLPRA